MKLGSIISLLIFLNFMALPSIASLCKWELPTSNVVLSEEETSHAPLVINEKSLPKILSIHDFLKFSNFKKDRTSFSLADHSIHLSIYLAIFSPPPDNLI
jgi:hypothetical protein